MGINYLQILEPFGYLFYIVNPYKHTYKQLEDVPDYVKDSMPYFICLTVIEQIIIFIKGLRFDFNDGITSLSQGIIMEQFKIPINSVALMYYLYIHHNWRILNLEWNSWTSWILALLIIDFTFYWFHRALHEINILWSAHQVHHSSEYFNLTTALRQSLVQLYFHMMFYLPLAFIISPSVFWVHTQLNSLFQIWIHTEIIGKLGIFEFIINTPSHHRVHHGRNRYCIDKNYAGLLIIWDRIFGTFQQENEPIVYGLTHSVNTFDPIKLNIHSLKSIYERLQKTNTLLNKVFILFKGPSWDINKPRLGLREDIPDVKYPIKRYNPEISSSISLYLIIHFLITSLIHVNNVHRSPYLPTTLFILFTFINMGLFYDKNFYAPFIEFLRCLLYFYIKKYLLINSLSFIIEIIFIISIAYWCYFIYTYSSEIRKKILKEYVHKYIKSF